jgi:hypothetical protein
VLIAALALAALPGLAGQIPRPIEPIPVGALQPLSVPANDMRSALSVADLDGGYLSSSILDERAVFIEPGAARTIQVAGRSTVDQPEVNAGSVRKPPRQTLKGQATFYHHGTTAMRLPRGTTVIICGAGGCVERIVNDYGPQQPERIVDLYVDDFFDICGCPSWSGVTDVTVYVY